MAEGACCFCPGSGGEPGGVAPRNALRAVPAEALVFRRQPDRRAVLEALHALGRTSAGARQLAALLDEIVAVPTPPLPALAANAVVFADVVLRLGILNELMYERRIIKPKFDVWEWVKTYEQREIDIEEEGYDIIPEALAYFGQIPLTPALLARVRELNFEFGRPDFTIVAQVFPFIDGEGDELWLTDLTDLAHCPNLERFFLCGLVPEFPASSLAPLLLLPQLREAHLDPRLSQDPAYQELERRGLLVE